MKSNTTVFRLFLATLALAATTGISQAAADPAACQEASQQVCSQPQESQCRSAIESMLQIIRATPLKTEREAKDVNELIARIEKMLADNRSKKIDECRSWAELGRIVANQ